MGKRKPSRKKQEPDFDKEKEVRLSGFIELDMGGEIIFHECFPCPKCDGKTSGEEAGIFQCPFCGWSPVEKYFYSHGYPYILECTWKFLKLFIHNKRLRWLVSEKLYYLNSELMIWYRRGRHRVSITDGDYMWSWSEKRWIKFL